MLLYLVRHGQAASKEQHPDRPLTAAGRSAVQAVAHSLKAAHVHPARIVHSGKRRAQETAQMLADPLGLDDSVEDDPELGPTDDPAPWAARVDESGDDLMLVGHLPYLGRLASLLLIGEPDAELFEFPAASALCLASDDSGGWRVRWMVAPDVAA